jgi:hypothetical protein
MGKIEQPFLDSSELMISQGLAHAQPSAMDPSRQAMLIHQSQGSGGGVSSSGGLASHMLLHSGGGSEAYNGSAGRTQQLPGLALSLDSMKPQVKRAAVGSAPSSGPPKKAPRLDIPEQGLHPGIQVPEACSAYVSHHALQHRPLWHAQGFILRIHCTTMKESSDCM